MKKLCIIKKRNINSGKDINIITAEGDFVKENCGSECCRNHHRSLLLAEGLAVGALIHSRIAFMGADQNSVQRAVVLSIAVISAGLNGTLDALVCIVIHSFFLLLFGFRLSMSCIR